MSNGRAAHRLAPEFRPTPLAVVNTRLVAAVQSRAGARCHESANLLHTYYLCADVYRSRARRGDDAAAVDAAWQMLKRAEVRIREFLVPSWAVAATPLHQ
jgi:hypothetical protein